MLFPSKERWEKQLSAAFGASYFAVAAVTLGPIHIMVFAHVGLRPVISDVHTDSVPCGFGGRLGNKGGVGVSFCVGNTSLLFVNCHLAAFQRNVPLRNANAARIDRMLALAPALLSTETRLRIMRDAEEQKAAERIAAAAASAAAPAAAAGATSATASPEGDESDDDEEESSASSAAAGVAGSATGSSNSSAAGSAASSIVGGAGTSPAASSAIGALPSSVASEAGFRPPPPPPSTPETAATARFDRVIMMGDMNYRLDGCTRAEADALVAANDLPALLAKDQLTAERRAGRVFPGFTEAPIRFRPTYKLDVGTDVYDSGEKRRIPAWTDRVLFKANEAGGSNADAFAVRFYDSINAMKHSDHRPVAASFTVRLRGSAATAAAGTAANGSAAAASSIAVAAESGVGGGASAGMPVPPPVTAAAATLEPIAAAAAATSPPAAAAAAEGSVPASSAAPASKPPAASATKRLCCWLTPRRSTKVAPAPAPPAASSTVTMPAKA